MAEEGEKKEAEGKKHTYPLVRVSSCHLSRLRRVVTRTDVSSSFVSIHDDTGCPVKIGAKGERFIPYWEGAVLNPPVQAVDLWELQLIKSWILMLTNEFHNIIKMSTWRLAVYITIIAFQDISRYILEGNNGCVLWCRGWPRAQGAQIAAQIYSGSF